MKNNKQGLNDRLRLFIDSKGLSVQKFEQICGLSNGSIAKITDNVRITTLEKISESFPDLDLNWLRTGYKTATPISGAIPFFDDELFTGGYLQGVGAPIMETQKVDDVKLPFLKFKDGDFAVQVHGRSMIDTEHPELSINDGAIVCLRPWRESFIEYGERYAIATRSGFTVKYIAESDREGYVKCVPANKEENFTPYYINENDITGIAKVTAIINMQILV